MNFPKKGQGLSLNAIIVALLALIVLVVLVVLFVTRTGQVDVGAQKAADPELNLLKLGFGDCHPSVSDQNSFTSEFAAADGDAAAEEAARSKFKSRISTCKAIDDKTACAVGTCSWK